MTPADLRAAREKLGLSQAKLGALIPSNKGGYTDGRTVRRWENGESAIPLHVAARLAEILEERT